MRVYLLKVENGNTLVYHIFKKDRNLDYARLYDYLVFMENPRIKKIQLKGILDKWLFPFADTTFITPKSILHNPRETKVDGTIVTHEEL